jgi:hypothetical protein
MVDPKLRSVAQQRADASSLLSLYRRLIEFRRALAGPFALLEVDEARLLYRRGRHVVDLNFGPSERSLGAGRPLLSTAPGTEIRSVPPFGGVIFEQAVV